MRRIQVSQVASRPHALPPVRQGIWGEKALRETIFVSIVSYRDSELPRTVRDLLLTAAHRCRVHIGIVYQVSRDDESSASPSCVLRPEDLAGAGWGGCGCSACTQCPGSAEEFLARNVRTLTIPHGEAKGPIFARSLAVSLYGGERYVLQVDSHMRSRQGWDAYLADLLEVVRASEGGGGGGCRPVLTTYPLGYHLPDQVPADTRPTVLVRPHGYLLLVFFLPLRC